MSVVELPETGLISRDQAAELLGKSPRTLDTWHRVGLAGRKLSPVKVGRTVYFRAEDLRAFVGLADAPARKVNPATVSKETLDWLRREGFSV